MRFTASISLICRFTFGAFAGMAQTLTCTFQFVASGTVGAQSFTNANITITTVGFTGNVLASGSVNGPYWRLTNALATINSFGIGTFQFMAATEIIAVETNDNSLVQTEAVGVALVPIPSLLNFQWEVPTTGPWTMLTPIMPSVSGVSVSGWNYTPVITTDGYTLNLYDEFMPLTFQAALSPGVPCAGSAAGNATDVQAVINEALGAAPAITDMNGDGVVNVVDIQFVLNAVLGCGITTSDITPAGFSTRIPVFRKRP
jgi:hypothetical protein